MLISCLNQLQLLLKANVRLSKVKEDYDEEKKIADAEIKTSDDELSDIKKQLQNLRLFY